MLNPGGTDGRRGRQTVFADWTIRCVVWVGLFSTAIVFGQDGINPLPSAPPVAPLTLPLAPEGSPALPGTTTVVPAPGTLTVPSIDPLQPMPDPWAVEPGEQHAWIGYGPWREPVIALLGLHDPEFLHGYYDPFSTTQFAYGRAGTTPYRIGWYAYQDVTGAPAAPTHPVGCHFNMLEWNSWMRYSTLLDDRHLFSWTGTWNARFWNGPSGIAFPSDGDQLMSDFQLASIVPEPWKWQIGITPQMNSDFQRQLNRNAFMVDGRVVVFNQISPELSLAVGVAIWDRAAVHVIPYGGVIWTPDDRWEFRATFPKTRISYYAGNHFQSDVWIYGSGEYTIDGYQIDIEDATRTKDRAEFRDYRLMLGVNVQQPKWLFFVEGGLITDRHVDFKGKTPDFAIGDAWIMRVGFAY